MAISMASSPQVISRLARRGAPPAPQMAAPAAAGAAPHPTPPHPPLAEMSALMAREEKVGGEKEMGGLVAYRVDRWPQAH